MTPAVLFVSNGHGEASIARRIARDLPSAVSAEHFPLVGDGGAATAGFPTCGPRAVMPSGGLVAMGNIPALMGDLRAGLAGLLVRQIAFLAAARPRYAAVVAVGDAFALALALFARLPTIFVGTAKSVYVAPYGPGERRLLRRARRVFVRDAATAAALQSRGVAAEAPGNVIVDLLADDERAGWQPDAQHRIAVLPGSRERAYADAARLAAVVRGVAQLVPGVAAAVSLAPTLDAQRLRAAVGPEPPAIWRGGIGGLLAGATLALGQAGTANEAAAAFGIPVVALDVPGARSSAWYRMRQGRLLGDALAIAPGDVEGAAAFVAALLGDPARRAAMAAAGRERMGPPGGAAAIAQAVAALTRAA